jgi:GAF domain-containing protein
MADVLAAINRSPHDLPLILDTLVRAIASRCETDDVSIHTFKDGTFTVAAHCGPIPTPPRRSYSLDARTPPVDAICDRRVIHIADMQEEERYPYAAATARQTGARTILYVSLLRGDTAHGVIILRRTIANLFSDEQVRLVETFANQAVIAIENARLLEAEQARTREVEAKSAELTESLEYQTATSSVLSVISRSRDNPQPVMEEIINTAGRLCGCDRGALWMLKENAFVQTAWMQTTPPATIAYWKEHPLAFDPAGSDIHNRVAAAKREVHIPDIFSDPNSEKLIHARALGLRSMVGVPLLRKGRVIAVLVLSRLYVKPFTDRQIDLLETFADQAVIAIENARLLDELQARQRELAQSLEYQTAISNVLGVISRSAFQLQPVLDTIASTTTSLCQAQATTIWLERDGELRYMAGYGDSNA